MTSAALKAELRGRNRPWYLRKDVMVGKLSMRPLKKADSSL